jgi:hypothetical protein
MKRIRAERESLQIDDSANYWPKSWKAKEKVNVYKIQEIARM